MIILPSQHARTRWDADGAQAWVSETFTWTDRVSYLAWVTAWKEQIDAKIGEVRRLKAVRRNPDTDQQQSEAQSALHYLRIECANFYLLRRMAKQLSNTQRMQRLTAELALS
jgi:hypothetical protein